MATQTGSIDLKSAKKAHDDAEKVATNYIETISGSGVFVHRNDSGYDGDHPTDSDAYGVHISEGVDIVQGGNSVAYYGDYSRIGRAESGYSKILLDPTSIGGSGRTNIFRIITANDATAHQIILDENNVLAYEINKKYSRRYLIVGLERCISTSEQTTSTTKTLSDVAEVPNGKEFYITVDLSMYNERIDDDGWWMGDRYYAATVHKFTKASSGSSTTVSSGWEECNFARSGPALLRYKVDVTYDPSTNQFTVVLRAYLTSAPSGNYPYISIANTTTRFNEISGLSYESAGELIPINQISGDVYACAYQNEATGDYSPLGQFYLGVNDNVVPDRDLIEAIEALGWDTDVFV